MSRHLAKEIDKLGQSILSLGAMVDESMDRAVRALIEKDTKLANEVIESDTRIDHAEVEIEEECLKILALHQPVAVDLRFIVSVLKINNDLERIGDLTVNIAERSVYLARSTQPDIQLDFPTMAAKTQTMLRNSLKALLDMDPVLARKVCAADDEVDALNRQMYDKVKAGISGDAEKTDALIHQLSISRHLERIADLATNIAEDVIYMIKGEIVRHKTEEYQS